MVNFFKYELGQGFSTTIKTFVVQSFDGGRTFSDSHSYIPEEATVIYKSKDGKEEKVFVNNPRTSITCIILPFHIGQNLTRLQTVCISIYDPML